jgi:hypothetical protein
MLGNMMPYNQMTVDQQAQNAASQAALQEKYWATQLPYSNLTADQSATLSGQMPNGQMTLPALNDAYNWANQAGSQTGLYTDPATGKTYTTVTASNDAANQVTAQQKLAAQITQWTNQDNIAITKNNLTAAQLSQKTQNDQQIISDAQSGIHNTQVNDTLNMLKSQMDSLATQMDSERSNGVAIDPKTSAAYQNLLTQAQKLVSSNFNLGSTTAGN